MTGTPLFRRATRTDLAAIIALIAQDTMPPGREDASEPLDPRYLTAFAAMEADPNQLPIVAELDGRVIGTLQLSFIPGLAFRGAWRGLIESVRIAAPMRGRGFGALLIAYAVEQCSARDCWLVQLTSNLVRTDAHRFYETLGWAKSHAGFKLHLKEA